MLVYARVKGIKPPLIPNPSDSRVTLRSDNGRLDHITVTQGRNPILRVGNLSYPVTHARVFNMRTYFEPLTLNDARLPRFLAKLKGRTNSVRYHPGNGLHIHLVNYADTWYHMPVESIYLYINADIIDRPTALKEAIKFQPED